MSSHREPLCLMTNSPYVTSLRVTSPHVYSVSWSLLPKFFRHVIIIPYLIYYVDSQTFRLLVLCDVYCTGCTVSVVVLFCFVRCAQRARGAAVSRCGCQPYAQCHCKRRLSGTGHLKGTSKCLMCSNFTQLTCQNFSKAYIYTLLASPKLRTMIYLRFL